MIVKKEIKKGIAWLTLNRPERRNAIGTETIRKLHDHLDHIETDDQVRVVVLTGKAPAFCAGSDLKELGLLDIDGMCRHEAETAALARRFGQFAKPILSVVDGYALGGGFILAISCDLVITSDTAGWHLPEVSNGWIPPWGLRALSSRVGPVRARHLTWGIDSIDGLEAHRLGVADYVFPSDQLLAQAAEIAGKLAQKPHAAVQSTKRFFQAQTHAAAEADDWAASHAFANDCRYEEASTTLEKFRV